MAEKFFRPSHQLVLHALTQKLTEQAGNIFTQFWQRLPKVVALLRQPTALCQQHYLDVAFIDTQDLFDKHLESFEVFDEAELGFGNFRALQVLSVQKYVQSMYSFVLVI